MSPIRLMMKPPSWLPSSSWLSRFLSNRRRRCCVWKSIRSSRPGKSFPTVSTSICRSFCRPLLYTSDMMRNVRMWCISVCISSERGVKKKKMKRGSDTELQNYASGIDSSCVAFMTCMQMFLRCVAPQGTFNQVWLPHVGSNQKPDTSLGSSGTKTGRLHLIKEHATSWEAEAKQYS